MQIKTTKQNLQKAVGRIIGVVNSRATMPILSNILVETEGVDTLCLTGTDLELGVSTSVAVDVKEPGSVTIPAKKLHDILRELPETDVDMHVGKNHSITIEAGKGQFRILGAPEDDFPKLPSNESPHAFEMEQATLKECLNLTSFAASHDHTRYVLNGTLFVVKKGELRLIATDGRRLSFVRRDLPAAKNLELEVVIPTKAISELGKLLTDSGIVRILPLNNQIAFEVDETRLISRLIEGHFPNYEQVIPKEEKSKIAIDREALLAAIRRASLLTTPEAMAVKLDILSDKILISSRTPNVGESHEELNAKLTGGEMAIGFNPQYLIDVLKNLNDDEIFLSLTDSDKSGIVRGRSEEYLYVIMPMQLT